MNFANSVAVSTTRPNDTNGYAAGDCVGQSTASGGAVWTFPNIGPSGGGECMLTTLQLEVDLASVPSGMTSFTLYLYKSSPPSAFADNGAWDLPAGDRASFVGYVSLGTPVDVGSTLYVETVQYNKQVNIPANPPLGGTLYGYLVTTGAYTDAASTVYKVTLHSMSL